MFGNCPVAGLNVTCNCTGECLTHVDTVKMAQPRLCGKSPMGGEMVSALFAGITCGDVG